MLAWPDDTSRYRRPVRELHWGSVPNIRDLGGLPGFRGPTRFGRIARGPRRELLDSSGWQAARDWGLRTVVDLRCPYETGLQDGDPGSQTPHGVTVIAAPTEDHDNAEFRRVCFPILDSPEYWPHNLRILPWMVRATLEAIADATPGILVHCSAGRDRTGMVTALLLGNAGVSPEAIADDYALSVRAMAGVGTHAPTHDAQTTWNHEEVDSWIAAVRPMVEHFARATPEHLNTIGLSAETRQRLQDLLLADER